MTGRTRAGVVFLLGAFLAAGLFALVPSDDADPLPAPPPAHMDDQGRYMVTTYAERDGVWEPVAPPRPLLDWTWMTPLPTVDGDGRQQDTARLFEARYDADGGTLLALDRITGYHEAGPAWIELLTGTQSGGAADPGQFRSYPVYQQEAGEGYDDRRHRFEAPLGPCGFHTPWQDQDPTALPACRSLFDDRPVPATAYPATTWTAPDGRTYTALGPTPEDPQQTRYWFQDRSTPVAVERTVAGSQGERLEWIHLSHMEQGALPFGPNRPATDRLPGLERDARTPWTLPEQDSGLPFPLSAALEAARDDPRHDDVAAFLETHPEAYVAWADHRTEATGPLRSDTWTFRLQDAEGGLTAAMTHQALHGQEAWIPVGAVRTEAEAPWAHWPNDWGIREAPRLPAPDRIPDQVPTEASVLDRAADWLGTGPDDHHVNFLVHCADPACDEAGLVLHTRFTGADDNMQTVTMDGDGHLLRARATTYNSPPPGSGPSPLDAPMDVLTPSDARPAGDTPAAMQVQQDPNFLGRLGPAHLVAAGVLGLAAAAIHTIMAAAKAGALPLFSRLKPDELLDHPLRKEIHALVRDQPGIHFRELRRCAGRSKGVMEHHLKKLVDARIVVQRCSSGYSCYFLNGIQGDAEMAAMPFVKSATAKRILRAIRHNEGRPTSHVAAAAQVSPSHMSYHLKRLQAAELVRVEGQGRIKALRLSRSGRRMLKHLREAS